MSDIDLLLTIVLVFYASECLFQVLRGDVAFHFLALGRGRVFEALAPLDRSNTAFAIGQPIAGLADTFIGAAWPFAINETHLILDWTPEFGPTTAARVISIDAARKPSQEKKEVIAGKKRLFVRDTPSRAARLAETIDELSRAREDRRAEKIAAELNAALDERAVKTAIVGFRRETRLLRILSAAFFLIVVVGLPGLLLSHLFAKYWFQWLMSFLAVWMVLMVEFRGAAGEMKHLTKRERRMHVLMMFLTPLLAPRACDLLSRDLLALFHPVAIGAVVLPRARYVALAGSWLRRVMYSRAPTDDAPADVVATDRWFREKLLAALERQFQRCDLSTEKLLAPPERDDAVVRTYCPRCRSQYTLETGVCEPCGGIELIALPPHALTPTEPNAG